MPVVRKSHKSAKKSVRTPTTVTIAPRRTRKKAPRADSATIVSASGVAPAARKRSRTRKSGKDHGQFPSWRQLESKKNKKLKPQESVFLDAVSTFRFALLLAGVAAAFTLYVGHVHATQDLLVRVEDARRTNDRMHLKHNRLKGEFDRLTGPAEIYRRAGALGFVQDASYAPTIVLED